MLLDLDVRMGSKRRKAKEKHTREPKVKHNHGNEVELQQTNLAIRVPNTSVEFLAIDN
jgi:hypothetical protein